MESGAEIEDDREERHPRHQQVFGIDHSQRSEHKIYTSTPWYTECIPSRLLTIGKAYSVPRSVWASAVAWSQAKPCDMSTCSRAAYGVYPFRDTVSSGRQSLRKAELMVVTWTEVWGFWGPRFLGPPVARSWGRKWGRATKPKINVAKIPSV